jgi:hypothetical protein
MTMSDDNFMLLFKSSLLKKFKMSCIATDFLGTVNALHCPTTKKLCFCYRSQTFQCTYLLATDSDL